MKLFKRLFCKHDYTIVSWSWYYGPNFNDPKVIRYAQKCKECGKIEFKTANRKSGLEEYLLRYKNLKDKPFSLN